MSREASAHDGALQVSGLRRERHHSDTVNKRPNSLYIMARRVTPSLYSTSTGVHSFPLGWQCTHCMTKNAAEAERCVNAKCCLLRKNVGIAIKEDLPRAPAAAAAALPVVSHASRKRPAAKEKAPAERPPKAPKPAAEGKRPAPPPPPPPAAADKPTDASACANLLVVRDLLRSFAKERDWDQFHTPRNICLALVGEIGELCECFQWKGDAGAGEGLPNWEERKREALGDELADVLLYLVRLADKCDIDLSAVTAKKLRRNAEKYPADRVRGSSKKYNEYGNGRSSGAGSSSA